MERWLDVVGYEGVYRVSDHGRVSGPRRSILATPPNERGYPQVGLYRAGVKRRTVFVHQLVAAAFLGPAPAGQECRHIDGDSGNPALSNLRYGTHSQNAIDGVEHGVMPMGEGHPHAKLTEADAAEIRRRYRPYCQRWGGRACAERYGVSTGTISAVVAQRTWKARAPRTEQPDQQAL